MLCSRGRTGSVFALLALFTASVIAQAPPKVQVEREKVVKVGDPFEFVCRVARPIDYCGIKFGTTSIKIKENTKRDDLEYSGRGFQNGDCGIKIYSVKENMHGNFTCTVSYPDIELESVGFTQLTVAIPPTRIDLTTNKAEYKEGEEMVMTCSTSGARPAPTVTLFLDNNTLAQSQRTSDSVNHNRIANYKDNNKKLVCRATHQALSEDDVRSTEKTLVVFFKPQPASQFGQQVNKFGFMEGTEGIISVDVFANPKPRFDWKIDGVSPDNVAYKTVMDQSRIQMNEDGSYRAELLIDKVRQEDQQKEFALTATNKLGSETYKVKISFEANPTVEETDLGAGAIVAIIVAVLIVFVAIFLTFFARSTGRWCFAAGVPTAGDKEALEDPAAKSGGWLSQVTSYKAVATMEEASAADTQPKSLYLTNNEPTAVVLETNIDEEESSDTESADKVPATSAARNMGIRIQTFFREKINSFRTSTKVPSSEEEAKDVEAAEQKTAPETGSDGVVYAELEMKKPGEPPVIKESDEKTEYAEIIHGSPNAAKV
ncbi:fasciclin-3-like isoform X2 [Neocloeon triangulifer]|uniref:fasciclin-3-like isoform X2 n=1 Tax=Neocloeon triangulifer TaxID=2078957 RepID=UPI00286F2E19|nr:fasciclin-3-like isoform X2 [Neocloeon triangulifer]